MKYEKKKSNIFKGKWYQFQKIKFSILKEEKFFSKDDHEQRVSFFKENFKKKKKKVMEKFSSKDFKKIKSGNSSLEKRERKITHPKIVEQQSTNHLKANPKLWSFAGKTPFRSR